MLYQFLQLQYRAVILFLAVAHLCLALNDFLALGFDFRIFMLGSPKRIVLMLPVLGFFTYTLNFLGPPLVLIGLLSGPFFFAAMCYPLYAVLAALRTAALVTKPFLPRLIGFLPAALRLFA